MVPPFLGYLPSDSSPKACHPLKESLEASIDFKSFPERKNPDDLIFLSARNFKVQELYKFYQTLSI
jgi:hypothetical protein